MRVGVLIAAVLIGGIAWTAAAKVPAIGAGAILHPTRRSQSVPKPPVCDDLTFEGAGASLAGWRCRATGTSRGTIVYLHGVADNRGSGAGIIARFQPRGFDVIAYDSRAHGQSSGTACTYGFLEKEDLRRVLDTVDSRPIVLVGTSLGAAVALQEAAGDSRVRGIVAAETFADLRTVVNDRSPMVVSRAMTDRALALAEREAGFVTAAVSPVNAARQITVPVLLIHGAADVDTPPEHSRRVFAALAGPRQLLVVPNATHNQSLSGDAWATIDRWFEDVVTASEQ